EMGVLPEALFNYLLRLGWGYGDEDVISPERAIELFDIAGIGKSPSRFDLAKLQNLNGIYLRKGDDARLAALVAGRMEGVADIELLHRAMPVLKVRAKDINEIAEGASFLFAQRPLAMSEKAQSLLDEEARDRLALVHERLAAHGDWTIEALEASVKALAEELGLALGKLAQPLRAALIGQTTSPGIFDVLVLLGRDESLARIGAQARAPAGPL
ncbi:MAG: glutamate--tRNA ligase, partial [Alphaproteobacteria bacterium]|nr:glutamate--tRNA ligase [Alphaproteobacteria bacterium]